MVSDRLVVKTYSDIAQAMRNRFFPRRLIQDRNRMFGLLQPVQDTLLQLNKISYKPRFVEMPVAGNFIDVSNLGIPGIQVKKVLDINPKSQFNTIFGLYERMMFGQPIFFNLIRQQDNFIDYVFSREVYRQIEQKYQNKNYNWEFTGDKIILGEHLIGVTSSAVIIFIPYFSEGPNGEVPIASEAVGSSNGTNIGYTFFLKSPFIQPTSLSMTVGTVTITDDGNSNLLGTGVTGTINYSTGELVIKFATAPAAGPFVANYTQLDYSWEFTGKELSFFLEYLEVLVSFREGRAQGEMKIAEVVGNADDLSSGLEEKLAGIIEKYKPFVRLGRKF
jgi:hypothetical protein